MDWNIVFLIKENRILLGLKKRGFGEEWWNGFGGKIKDEETIGESAIRELKEESGLVAKVEDLIEVAKLTFRFPHKDKVFHAVAYFLKDWEGEAEETEEMLPRWFDQSEIPYEKMWDSDQYWIPPILKGRKIEAEFTFSEEKKVLEYRIKFLD